MRTLRQQIIHLLTDASMDLWSLSQALGLNEKEVLDHLPHIVKSLSAQKARLDVQPAVCRNCGFTFRERRRLSPPGRCPRCKQNRVEGPWYSVDRH